MKNRTAVERRSDREVVVTRTIDGPARLVFEAWTKPELLKRWWAPKSLGIVLVTCEADVRVDGRYRCVFRVGADQDVAFTGRYLEVTPHSRLVWTSDERGADLESVSTATFEERGGRTLLVVSEVYPSKEVLEEATSGGWEAGTRDQHDQLESIVAELAAGGASTKAS